MEEVKIEERKPHSQNSEELFILQYFENRTSGKFIDVGAYDTFRFSNVRALYEQKNFKGVLVEPAPANYRGIADNYKDDPEIIVLNVALGETNQIIDFYDSGGDAVSSSEVFHKNKWEAGGVKYTKIKVQQMAVADFFNKYGTDCDFLSVDVEATNIELMRNIPSWVWNQISMLCIEHDSNQEEIEETLKPYGFETLYVNSENIILAKP